MSFQEIPSYVLRLRECGQDVYAIEVPHAYSHRASIWGLLQTPGKSHLHVKQAGSPWRLPLQLGFLLNEKGGRKDSELYRQNGKPLK